jgi:hypothetical protein
LSFTRLTLLLVGKDALAEQLFVHLEHRGADLERADVGDALDTIRVAVPDLVIVSSDAAKTDAERIRDGVLGNAAQKTRLLVLCDKALASRLGTHRHTHLGALESSVGADVIASCIESLCGLIEKQGDAGKQPLRTLIASVQRSHMPAGARVSAAAIQAPPPAAYVGKKTLQMPIAIAVPAPAPAPAAVEVELPKPVALKLEAPIAQKAAVAPKIEPVAAKIEPIVAAKIEVPAPAAPLPLAKLLERTSIGPIAMRSAPPAPVPVLAPTEDSLEIDMDLMPTSPPSPFSVPPAIAPRVLSSRPEESLTPTHVEVVIASRAEEVASKQAGWLMAARAHAAASAQHASKALAAVARLRRPHQLAAIAAAFVCVAVAMGLSASDAGDDRAPLAASGSASLHAVARVAQPKAPAPAEPVEAAPPQARVASAVAAPRAATTNEALGEHEEETAGGMDPARERANQLVNVGHRLRKEARWGMAEASYLKALGVLPSYARAVSGLVQVHLGRRDGAEAVRWAKKLVALQPKPGIHHRLLGDAYALAGDKAQARKAWQQAARLGDRAARERMKK